MPLTDIARAADALIWMSGQHVVSLHSAWPGYGPVGANELTDGGLVPPLPLSRQPLVWNGTGDARLVQSLPITFTGLVPGMSIPFAGLHVTPNPLDPLSGLLDPASYWASVALGSPSPPIGFGADGSTDRIVTDEPPGCGTVAPCVSVAVDTPVVFFEQYRRERDGAGSDLPSGIVEGTIYYARSITTGRFAIAAAPGGAALNIGDGAGVFQILDPPVVDALGMVHVANLRADFNAA